MTILLGIYIGTIGFSIGSFLLTEKARKNKLKRNGYKYKKDTRTLSEKSMEIIKDLPITLICFCCPIINIVAGLVCFSQYDEFYNSILKENLEEGKLYKVETTKPVIKEQIKNLINEYSISREEVLELAGVKKEEKPKEQGVPNYLPTKPFSEMTRKEIIIALQRVKEELEKDEEKEEGQTLKLGM